MTDWGRGIAVAGMWIGVGVAVIYQPLAIFGFSFAALVTVCVYK